MTHTSPMRRRLSVLAATALVASLLATGALPAASAGHHAIELSTTSVSPDENGTATFTVTLSEVPTAEVLVDVTSDDPTVVTVGPATLTFDANVAPAVHTVTVTGVNNTVTDGNAATSITLDARSADLAYDGLPPASVTVTRVDDEVPGITVTPGSGLITNEDGTTASFAVALSDQPTATVTVSVTANDPDEATADATELTFTTGNWNEAQTVTVTGVDDDVIDGSANFTFTLTASNTGGYASTVTAQVTGSNADNDSASLIVAAPEGGLVTGEAGTTDTFSIRLSTQPTHDVIITFTSSDTTEATVASPLTIAPANWSTPHDVTVTGVNDNAIDGDIAYTITGKADSADGDYNGPTTGNIAGTNADNDVAPAPAGDPGTEDGGVTFNDTGSLDSETVAAIDTLVALEITQGTSASLFSPSQVVSRWQMALFLSRQLAVHGVTLPTPSDQGFTDLGGLDAETRNAISQIAALDVTTGTGTGTYSPDAGVTRWQMALFMTRVLDAAGVDLPTTFGGEFDDIGDLSPEAQLAIRELAALGVVLGVGDGAFDPTAEIPRWQMALFIVRTLEAAGVSTS